MNDLENDIESGQKKKPPRLGLRLVMGVLGLLALGVVYGPVNRHLEGAALLMRFEGGDSDGLLSGFRTHELDERDDELSVVLGEAEAPVPIRIYSPRDFDGIPPSLILVHGVHYGGIEEPRLVAFARNLAMAGIEVLTPQIESLTEYQITSEAIAVIGAVAKQRADELGHPVAVMGISFGGGLSLMAAAGPDYRSSIDVVAAIGAHHDLLRVARWYAGEGAAGPGGQRVDVEPAIYGAAIAMYRDTDAFFERRDRTRARTILRHLLRDEHAAAQRNVRGLSQRGRDTMRVLLEQQDNEAIRASMLRLLEEHAEEYTSVSPMGHLGDLSASIFLLHGVDDPIIPSTETWWIASELPADRLSAFLVTPFLRHSEATAEPSFGEKFELVGFMAALLEAIREPVDG